MSWFSKKRRAPVASAPVPAPEVTETPTLLFRRASALAVGGSSADSVSAASAGLAADFPHFQLTAADQLDPRLSGKFSSARQKLSAAYTPSQPVTDRRMFAGRTGVLTTLIRSIEDQRLHAVIYGERGIGKTSLLHILSQAARDARYIVIYLSCGANSNFDDSFRALAGGIPLLYHRDYGPTSPRSEQGATFADLLGPDPVPVRMASDILAKVTGTRVLVVLDEFDRCESAEFRQNIAELLKNLSDRSVRVQLVIAGVADNLTELVEHIPSIERNIFALQVPRMTSAEVRRLVTNGEAHSGLHFAEIAIDLIVTAAGGLPYLASLLSHHAGLTAIEQGGMAVTNVEVAKAIDDALGEFKGRISKRSQLQIAECAGRPMNMLGRLAGAVESVGGEFTMDDVSTLFHGSEQILRCKNLIETLSSDGVLLEAFDDEYGRRYRFREESVPAYLRLLAARDDAAQLEAGPSLAANAPRAGAEH